MNEQIVDQKYILQSVENALAIIDLLCEEDNLGAAEIAQRMNLGKSTVFRLVSTLVYKGFVSKDDNSKYHLSFKFAGIGNIVTMRSELIKQVHPYLNELSSASGETAHLVIWHTDLEVIFVDKVIGRSSIRMDSMVGLTRLAHMTATGKVLLAYSLPSAIECYLRTAPFLMQTRNSIPNSKILKDVLAQILLDGYACDNEESENGLTCFSAPIVQMSQVVAAISISGPSARLNSNKQAFTELVKIAAQKASSQL